MNKVIGFLKVSVRGYGDDGADGRFLAPLMTAVRAVLGWHLAYLGVWALTSEWDYSWVGCFRCANWLFSGAFRAVAASGAMPVVDAVLAWGLLVSGALLMIGRFTRPAAVFGVFYFTMIYLLNPPHFGHTGESHFMFLDRNVVEIFMLFLVMSFRQGAAADSPAAGKETV